MFEKLLSNPVSVLFLIIAIGYAVGRIKVYGVSLGSAAVLFVALVFGHYGMGIPKPIADLGVILFVYSVGLQAGPRFFSTLHLRGVKFAKVGIATILTAAILTWVIYLIAKIPVPLIIGIFAGALTSTPALAAALDTLSDPLVSVGYGIAYPFGVVGVVLAMQLIPRFMKPAEVTQVVGEVEEVTHITKIGTDFKIPSKKYRVENSQCDGKSLAELDLHRMTEANISRVRHGDSVMPVKSDTRLHLGDIVLAVGPEEELKKMEWIFGPEIQIEMHYTENVIARDIYVSEAKVAGKTIAELRIAERFNVVVSRMYREDIELVPTGRLRLEIGDLLRVVGSPEDCMAFVKFIGHSEKRIQETTILPFSLGLVLGVALAYMPIPLPGGINVRLGLAGGPLFIGLILGYFGGIGSMRLHTPYAVRYLLRELGLVFFLAGAGTAAGAHFIEVFQQQGINLIIAGAFITTIPLIVAFLLSNRYYGFDLPGSLGAVCGSMTSTPGLGAATSSLQSDEPALSYAAVYPISLVVVTVIAQLMSLVF